jgi:Skp family chaperone for outer membrane proteins
VSDAIGGAGLDATLRDFSGGQKIYSRYTLTKVLGRGGMGIVWLAHDDELERDVALKFLPELLVLDRAVLGDLKHETKRSLELTHKNIVRIHDFVHDDISGAISMEFIDGDTLSNLRADKPTKIFEPDELRPWLSQLCDALDYAHTHAGVVHRDLKPSNLMVNKRNQLKIADFGIARSLTDSMSMLTQARGTSGTLVYMSPQQLDGERGTHLDDVYSLGATVYELLTSKPPFYSGNIDRQIREKIPPPMAQRRKDLEVEAQPIPQNWEETIAACLAKDPAKRPQSVTEIARRLALSSQPIANSAHTPAALGNKTRVVTVGAVAALILLGATAYLVRSTILRRAGPQVIEQRTASLAPVPSATERPALANEPAKAASPEQAKSEPIVRPTRQPAISSERYDSRAGFDPAVTFVDMNRLFKEYDKTKDAEAKINDAKSAAKRDYDDRANVYKKALDEINALNKQLDSRDVSADAKSRMARERDNKIANVKNMEREINEFRQTRERQLQEQALRMREGIVSEIKEKIASLDNHLNNLIFDKSGNSLNGVPILMFTPDRADMSAKVIAGLNQNQSSPFLPTRSLGLGLVDMNRVFRAYNKTKTAEAKVNEAKNAAKKDYDARGDAYKRALDDVNKLNKQIGAGAMAGAELQRLARERDDRIAKVKNMEKETSDFRTAREKQLQDEASQMRNGIVAEITKVIGTGLRSVNDAILIDTSGNSLNGVPVAIYTKGVPDFSEQIISALNGNKNSLDFDRSLVSSTTLRFGIVDMNRAFKEWPDTKSAEAKINDAKAQAKKEYDDRSDAYKKALDEINALNKELDAPGLSAGAKTLKAKERDDKIANIKNMEKEISDFRTTREKQLQEQALRMRENIVSRIKMAVNDCAETERLNVAFDSSGNSLNGVPIVLLSRDIPDLTDAVVALGQR